MGDFDVLVVGAGPAGSTAALTTARRGLRVGLVDRQAFPRDKPCGDGIGPGVVRLLRELLLGDVLAEEKPMERREERARTTDAHDSVRLAATLRLRRRD